MNFVLFGLAGIIVGTVFTYLFMFYKLRKFKKQNTLLINELIKKESILIERNEQILNNYDQIKVELQERLNELNKTIKLNTELQTKFDFISNEKDGTLDLYKSKNNDLENRIELIRNEKMELQKKVLGFEDAENARIKLHDERAQRLNITLEALQNQKDQEELMQAHKEEEQKAFLNETWQRHESNVEEKIKLICQRQQIEYIDKEKFPHRGKPDNSVKICDEYIVFDSKSPDGESLLNFPSYLKKQIEAAKKYADYDAVKNDIFFVVPISAIECIKETYIECGKYRVHIITEDALEPILISLKKIEDYEFAEQLSPEDREKIVTVIGKMAHGMKRRIQMDFFFANEYLAILNEAANLPEEIRNEAAKVEKSSKLNPPQEKRIKIIDDKELAKEGNKILGKASGEKIDMEQNMDAVNSIPLYKKYN